MMNTKSHIKEERICLKMKAIYEPIIYGSNSYQYDQDGFLKSKTEIDQATNQPRTTTYQYGTLGELRSVTLPDNTSIE
jgi:hypothetical protein